MNLLDLVIILILVVNMMVGWRKGLLGMLGEMGGLTLGLWLGVRYTKYVAGFVSIYLVGPAWLLFLLSFLGLFLCGRLTGRIIVAVAQRTVTIPGLSTVDRITGAALGLGIGTIMVTFLMSLCAFIPLPYLTNLIQTSEVGQYFWSAAPVFNRFLWQEIGPRLLFPPVEPGSTGLSAVLVGQMDM
ncbi:MAG: CvpA family protein [bacterium]